MDTFHKTAITVAEITKRSHRELLEIPNLLPAAFISLLIQNNLYQNDKRSAFEAILALQEQRSEVLASAIRFLSTLAKQELKKVPAIDLSEASILNWTITARASVATPEHLTRTKELPAKKKEAFLHKSLDIETRANARNLLNELIEANLLASKVVGLFRTSIKGENLIYTNDGLRSDLISYLKKIEHEAATKLIHIYEECAKNRTMQERITLTQLDLEAESASDSFKDSAATARKNRTIAEVIAERKAQFAREKARDAIKQTPQQLKAMMASLEIELECEAEEAKGRYQEIGSQQQEEEQEETEAVDLNPELDGSLSFSDEEDEDEDKIGEENEFPI